MPRSRNTATMVSGSQCVRTGSGFWKFCTIGMTRYAIMRSPAATTAMPTTDRANAHQYGRT